MNTHVEVIRTGRTIISGKAPVLVRDFIGRDAPGEDVLNVAPHPDIKEAVFERVTLLRGAQGLAVHGGDCRYRYTFRDFYIADMVPVMLNGVLNGDSVDLFGASRIVLDWFRCERGYGGVKLGGGDSFNNTIRNSFVSHFDSIGLVANGRGHCVENVVFDDCAVGIEIRPGMSVVKVLTVNSRRCGALITGSGVVMAVDCRFDSIEIDSETTFHAVRCEIGKVIRNDGKLIQT